jgi:hypothetical protein
MNLLLTASYLAVLKDPVISVHLRVFDLLIKDLTLSELPQHRNSIARE